MMKSKMMAAGGMAKKGMAAGGMAKKGMAAGGMAKKGMAAGGKTFGSSPREKVDPVKPMGGFTTSDRSPPPNEMGGDGQKAPKNYRQVDTRGSRQGPSSQKRTKGVMLDLYAAGGMAKKGMAAGGMAKKGKAAGGMAKKGKAAGGKAKPRGR
jgi:hypothetical protein